MEILRTGALHKETCVQSLWETVKCRDKGKIKIMLHKDASLRMCVFSLPVVYRVIDGEEFDS